MPKFEFERGKMVPVPSHSIVPERDVEQAPRSGVRCTWASTSAA